MAIKLYNDDCLNLLGNLPDDSIMVSDPPYNINYHYRTYNDNLEKDKYFEMLQIVFGGKKHVLILYNEILIEYCVRTQQIPTKTIAWVYPSNTAKQHRVIAYFNIKPDFRLIGQPYRNPNDKRIKKLIKKGKQARLYDWWKINQVKNVNMEKTIVPCQIPLEVMRHIIGIIPDEGTIVDPFMGSGVTGVAAKKFNRDFIGIELDSMYFKAAKKFIKYKGVCNEHSG